MKDGRWGIGDRVPFGARPEVYRQWRVLPVGYTKTFGRSLDKLGMTTGEESNNITRERCGYRGKWHRQKSENYETNPNFAGRHIS